MMEQETLETFRTYVQGISPLREETLEELQACFDPIQLKKHEFFVNEGAFTKQLGFLTQGIIRSFFLNQEGKEYNKQFFVGPSLIGAYTALITKQPAAIAQQALTDCYMLAADFEKIELLFHKHHDLERLGRKIAEFYFVEKEQKEVEMALLDADRRYLLMRNRFPTIESIIPQYHIASYLGISPTQLSRIRRKLVEP